MISTSNPSSLSDGSDPAPSRTWSLGGGLGILTGGVLLFVATLIESGVWGDPFGPVLPLLTVLFIGSAVAHAAAMIPFSLGSTGADGVVGPRMLGKYALLVFGAAFLLNQTIYFVTVYGSRDVVEVPLVAWLPPLLGGVQFVALLVGSIAVVRAGAARGAARWAFPALFVVAVVAAGVVLVSADATVVTLALLSSCGAQIVAGAVIARHRPEAGGGTV